jgi:hypothetical protein
MTPDAQKPDGSVTRSVAAPSSDAEKWAMIERLRTEAEPENRIDYVYALGIHMAHEPFDQQVLEVLQGRASSDRSAAVRAAAVNVLLSLWDAASFQFALDHVLLEQDRRVRADIVDAVGSVLGEHYVRTLSVYSPAGTSDTDVQRALKERRSAVEGLLAHIAGTDLELSSTANAFLKRYASK